MKNRKSILITGATSGVGYALTKRLRLEGYEVWATGRSSGRLTGVACGRGACNFSRFDKGKRHRKVN